MAVGTKWLFWWPQTNRGLGRIPLPSHRHLVHCSSLIYLQYLNFVECPKPWTCKFFEKNPPLSDCLSLQVCKPDWRERPCWGGYGVPRPAAIFDHPCHCPSTGGMGLAAARQDGKMGGVFSANINMWITSQWFNDVLAKQNRKPFFKCGGLHSLKLRKFMVVLCNFSLALFDSNF